MVSKPSGSKPKPFVLALIILSLILLLVTTTFRPNPLQNHHIHRLSPQLSYHLPIKQYHPKWYHVIKEEIKDKNIKIGLVNMDEESDELHGLEEAVRVRFDRVAKNLQWKDFFPEWIDQDEIFGQQKCPEIPMPRVGDHRGINVVVARVPCGRRVEKEGVRDVLRLQVNLVIANLLVNSGSTDHEVDRMVYVVFIGSCGPMWEIFRCDDLLWHEGKYRVYRPDLRRLKQKVLMPVGSCQLVPPFSQAGREVWRRHENSSTSTTLYPPREAYVTILHSSESYVCGAIALAQSIIQTNSTKDLVLLADDSISTKALQGLRAAGWKIKHIKRIRSPGAEKDAYNEWNYSKLRVWQLTEYEKIIFIDADLIVLKNIDKFFVYPQVSAASNDKFLFNSGVMLVEPSKCMFEALMKKRFTLASYNGGDQGFLNEVFTWWHRWPSRLNHLKVFGNNSLDNPKHEISKNLYMIHYLGVKPWMCYKDYDCNWDVKKHNLFASDSAHRRWWQVYRAMPKKLRPYCAPSKSMDSRIRKWKVRARNGSFPDGHWKIKVRDNRRH
ncbi:unnamed protein product [Ilex paraguariensis]|uniref:Hexosyltransferase n=1 Tax=Ilex paraguariensis TaxID=185542 RepID=A0ABC8UCH1_9AQUA